MMAPVQMRLRITIEAGSSDAGVTVAAKSSERVGEVLARVVRECGLGGEPAAWNLLFTDRILPAGRFLRDVVPSALDPVPLTLRPAAGAMVGPASSTSLTTTRSRQAVAALLENDAPATMRELDVAVTPAERTRPNPARSAPARVAVQYHSRMNPGRAYPLTLTLSRDDAARLGQTKGTPRPPLEVEPVLPGCAVYPPRAVVRLDGGEEVIRFHVVPQVAGAVAGARVLIRQDNATLAEPALDVRVTRRAWAWAAGLAAIVLPLASAAMSEAGFEVSAGDGFRPVLSLFRFFTTTLPPVALGGLLGLVAAGLWWAARPHARDAAWDVTGKPAG